MTNIFKGLGILIAVVLFAGLLGFLGNLMGFWQYSFFLPRITAVQNQTFHQSQQYTEGKLNALRSYETQYNTATTQEGKDAIKAMVRDEFGSYDNRNLVGHPDLESFLNKMEAN